MGSTIRVAGLLTAIALAGGCLAPVAELAPSGGAESSVAAWVLDHGWHTAIVVRRSDVDVTIWPEVDDFVEATFVEVAWGDRDFYMAKPATLWLGVKAAFLASGSVLHVVGFGVPIATYFAESEVVELRLSRRGFDAMTRFVHDEYRRDHGGRTLRLERGRTGRAGSTRRAVPITCSTPATRGSRGRLARPGSR